MMRRAGCILAIGLSCSAVAAAQTTTFTYQGTLTESGTPAAGDYQMQFRLYDALAGGSQVGSTIPNVAVSVANGMFTTQLDFGASPFAGTDRFLEIDVRKLPTDGYVTLSPRQRISSSPYAIKSLYAGTADDALKLGGVAASQYVTTANFNVSGNGIIGGNLGIGTSAPSQRLQVDSGNVLVRGAGNFGAIGDRASVLFGDTNHYISGVRSSGVRIGTFGIGDAITLLQSSGNVGIGTTSPAQKLEVNGVIKTTAAVSDCPSGWFCTLFGWDVSVASVLANGFVQRSDARLKRNIQPLHESRDKLLALSGVSYEWKEGKPGTHYGFIAQDVEEVLPEIVKTDDRGYKSVDYMAVIPFIVETIKAQQRAIHDLERRVSQLEALQGRPLGESPSASVGEQ